DRNRSHWSTSKTPSYTKSVSWQHHLKTHVNTLLSTQKNILFSFKSPFSAIKKHQTVILLARR
ncbi:hypothetical protein, partial [Escherichia coli]|uniref:hypothetical protein n=1 Tax=Escherichia coli TaxID=562 RepID=UPI00313D17AB